MDENEVPIHYVCTRKEALDITNNHNQFWVSNCGCREAKKKCNRSRHDVCLFFYKDIASPETVLKNLSQKEVEDIFKEAEEKHLVFRPFRNPKNMTENAGICFCCDDCCCYFLDPNERSDKGCFIEKTNTDNCITCGKCADLCYFNAREMNEAELLIDRSKCYGCGLCADVCQENCIEMIDRKNNIED